MPGELLVRWKPALKPAARADALAPLGASRRALYDLTGIELLHVDAIATAEAVARLSQDPRVEYAEPNYLWSIDRTPDDPRYPEQYGLHNTGQTGGTPGDDIGAENAWESFTGDPDLLIGDIDTGADYDHPDLAANIWTNPGEVAGNGVDDDHNGYVDDVHGYDFFHHDGDPRDDNGHGTHTAGIIAAVGDNGVGVSGVVWHAKIVLLKFLGPGGTGPTSAAVEALQYATRMGIRVTNNSWSGGFASRALEDAVTAAGAAGALFVAAAGNSRVDIDRTPQYPASLPEDCVITVAATDDDDQLASFSNFGATSVDLAAPGFEVLSTYPGADYKVLSGTSMAAPHVTGAVAFLMGRFPRMDAAEVKARLLEFADARPALEGRCVSGGRLDLALAAAEPDSTPPGAVADLGVVAPGSNTVDLAWTATGDDGDTGTASRYDLRVATHAFAPGDFDSLEVVPGPRPAAAGERQAWRVRGLETRTTYWFALRAKDEFGNLGPVSEVVSTTTLGPPHLTLSATGVEAASTTGNQVTRTVELVNDSPGTLEWSAPAPALDPATRAAPWPAALEAKGEDGPARQAQAESAGGPDAFGYRWSDSGEPDGPAFRWVDVVSPANQVALSGDEVASNPIPLGFSFPFYGHRFTTVRVCTNGYLELSPDLPLFANTGLPSGSAPRNLIAPFWDDLHFGSGVRRAYAHFDGTRCVLSWEAVPRYNDLASVMTFQCILYPSGEIRFQYLRMTGTTTDATVGIQDSSRTVGLQVAFDQAYVRDSLAVRMVPVRQWLGVEPASGFLAPGARQTVALRFDATGLGTGVYAGRARFLTNDPAAADTGVSVSFAVTGAPDLKYSPASFDFGALFTGARDTLALTVANTGVDPLDVTGLATDKADFVVPAGGLHLLPGDATTLPVVFAPGAIADLSGTLSIASNDPDQRQAKIPLHGIGSAAPVIATSTTALRAAATPELDAGAATRERVLVIRNAGGAPLDWTASAYQGQVGARPAAIAVPTEPVPQIKGSAGPGAAALGNGGPDGFGYRWLDSDAPNGPLFAWQEIAGTGTRLFGGADDSTTRVALPFPFSFYGQTYDSVSVSTNGFLCFVGRDSALVNTDLPNAAPGVPRALVAPFWTDLDLRTVRGAGRAYAGFDGSKFIVEWKDAPHYSGPSPYTFQVFLWPSGQIEFQYLSLGSLVTAATIGIQDETGTVGLPVTYNALYVHANLRIRISHRDDWLELDRLAGRVLPGGADTLRVRFDSRQYRDGDYAGEVRIVSNDVGQPLLALPCAMHVGLLRQAAEAVPGSFDAVSVTPLVRFLVAPPGPGSSLDASSLRLNGTAVTPAFEPAREPDGRLAVSLRSPDLLALLHGGARDVSLSGEFADAGWFAAAARLAVAAPNLLAGPLPAFGAGGRPARYRAGEPIALEWFAPTGVTPDTYDVAYSADGGLRWAVVAHGPGTTASFAPSDSAASAMVEVVARSGDAVVGTWLSAPFVVTAPAGGPGRPPLAFAFRVAGASPARDVARFTLELPAAGTGDVAVFDLRGARVRDLAAGDLPAGRLPLEWDGRLRDGSRAAPGVYLIRARHTTGSQVLRLAFLR